MKKILIMGLPGSGKTTLAASLVSQLKAEWLNADKVRKAANDWDFSYEGIERQAKRMNELAKSFEKKTEFLIADFFCPTPKTRQLFDADFTIWVDTIKVGRFEDTNKMFIKPEKFDCRVITQDAKYWSSIIIKKLNNDL